MSGIPLRKLTAREGHAERYMASVITMISRSPKIQSAIMDGTQPFDLSLEGLMCGPIPLAWNEQDQRYGIGQ
jgi:hypothetical protein